MDFYAILDQVIALLRQRQRVTYRALQRQFDLDEDALNDLKDALLYAHPQVVDDEGRGLRWTGDTVSTPVQAPPSTPPASHRDAGKLSAGQAEEGLGLLREALVVVEKSGAHHWEAELYRLQGDLLLHQTVPDAQQAEACFCQALATARRQQAKSLELRAAMSLARLWQQQGKRAAACQMLAAVYGWFTEGFDTADLQEARALLDALT